MELQSTNCPICGGKLRIDNNPTTICPYCDNEIRQKKVAPDIDNKIKKAFDLIASQRYVSAENMLQDILKEDDQHPDIYLGLLLCNVNAKNLEQLQTKNRKFYDNENYLKYLELADGESVSNLISICEENRQLHNY